MPDDLTDTARYQDAVAETASITGKELLRDHIARTTCRAPAFTP